MEETEQTVLIEGDPDATLIAPRFDEQELGTAQPVVPLAVMSPDAFNYGASPSAQKNGTRRSWPLALVLLSALAGSALGVAGLYFYQQRQETPVDSASGTTAAGGVPDEAASSSSTPATAESAIETVTPAPAPAQGERSAAIVQVAADNKDKARTENERDEKDAKKKKDDDAPPPRKVAERDEDTGAFKHGKKGAREETADEAAQLPQRPRRVERPSASDDEQTARGIGTIIYPENRRARQSRREQRQRNVDRVRGIFEGLPPE